MQKIKYDKKESICACKVSLDILGDKWSLIIVRDIFKEKTTFSEFLYESDEGISSNILVDRLKKLISLEIIDFIREPLDKKILPNRSIFTESFMNYNFGQLIMWFLNIRLTPLNGKISQV
jgi:hypothetical protein